jgi:hypothetical protein
METPARSARSAMFNATDRFVTVITVEDVSVYVTAPTRQHGNLQVEMHRR